MNAVAFASLLCATLIIVAFMTTRPHLTLWPALASVAALAVALWLNDRFDSVLFGVNYLVVGAAAVYWYCITFFTQMPDVAAAEPVWLAVVKIALVMAASVGLSTWSAIAWPAMGFLTAELVAWVAKAQTGAHVEPDNYTPAVALIAITLIVLSSIARARSRKTQPQLHRAAREERMAALRAGMELKAAALLHDTVLSHLAAIANTPKTELTPELATQIRRDLEILVGEEWLRDVEQQTPAGSDWRKSPLYLAVQDAKLQGLVVDGTGDIAAVGRLDRARSNALGLAAKQCLANVIKHSGTMKAEVAVYGSDAEVSVMIVDGGKGFELTSVGSDRLGLRASVRRRIETVGGTVQVWSTPGNGTSVLIRVPVASPAPGHGPVPPSQNTGAAPSSAETLVDAQAAEESG